MRRRPRALIAEIAARDPAVADLARVISPAVQVEPQLLRRARIELVPGATAATEADLWFSALVGQRSPAGIVLDPDVRRELRGELAGQPALLGGAFRVIAAVHADEVPVIRAEEHLVALGLLAEAQKRAGADAQVSVPGLGHGAEAGALIEEELRALATAMRRAAGPGFARWVARALPALPPAAGTSATAWTLALGASIRLGGRRVLPGLPPDEVTPETVAWLLPEDGPRTEVGVRLLAGGLEFSTADIPLDAQVIRPPRTDPLILGVSYLDGVETRSRRVVLPAAGTATVPVVSDGLVAITTALGHRYTIEPERSARSNPVIFIARTGRRAEPLGELVISAARDAGANYVSYGSEPMAEDRQAARYQGLSQCDAAVILLTRDALRSAWVRREVSTLMWRRSLQADFLVLPVLASDLRFYDVRGSALAGTGLTELEFLAESEPRQTEAQVREALHRFVAQWHQPRASAAAPAAPPWRVVLDCPEVVTIGEAITVVVGVTSEPTEDLPLLAAVPEGAEIRVTVTAGRGSGSGQTVASLAALAQDPIRHSFSATPGLDQTVDVQAVFSAGDTALGAVSRRVRVVDTASAGRPATYRDETGERQLVIIDRHALRAALRELLDPDGQLRILVVNGPPRSGKSFTYRMAEQAAARTRAFQTIYEDLASLPAPTPEDLARRLALRIGGVIDTIPPAGTWTARSMRELARWLLGQLAATSRGWCWILDGLSSPSLPAVTRDFVLTLADEARPALLRLVLLDFDGALPSGTELSARREELTPIGEPEVREFFSDLQVRGEIDVGSWTRAALEGLPAGPGRLGALSARLSGYADMLANVR